MAHLRLKPDEERALDNLLTGTLDGPHLDRETRHNLQGVHEKIQANLAAERRDLFIGRLRAAH